MTGTGGAPIFAHENVAQPDDRAAAPTAPRWPTDSFFVKQKDLFMNGEPVQLLHARPRTPTATRWSSSAAAT